MDHQADQSPADEDLIRRFRDGDEASFDLLVLRYRKEIYRIAYRITGDHAEADDLAQETFCRAYTALHSFRGESSLKTWLCRIVSNLSLNIVQSARVARRDTSTVEGLAESGAPNTLQAPVGAEELIRIETNARLRQAIEALPKKQKSTLILRAFEGLQYKEIARVMGIRPGTVRSTAFRALDALGRALKETS